MPLRPCLAPLSVVALLATAASAAELRVPADFPTPQAAIDASADGDVIVVSPGTYGVINPFGRAITIRSEDPGDPEIVATTILDGGGTDPVVTVFFGEGLDTVIEGFTLTNGFNRVGGGVAILGSDPRIRDCVIRNNEAEEDGGGIYASSSSAVFDRCTIVDNVAREGGGVSAFDTVFVRFNDCTIARNASTFIGGGISARFASLRFYRCVVAENSSETEGGGYSGRNVLSLFVSSLVRDNVAPIGGGFSVTDNNVRLVNSTVVDNEATGGFGGGAIWGLDSQPLIRGSIVRSNGSSPLGGFMFNPVAEYSNVEGGLSGPGNIDVDPLFVDPGSDDFRLQAGSPSRDTGFNGWVTSYNLDDLNGAPRIQDGVVDMGAYEVAGSVPPPSDARGELVVGLKDDGSLAFGLPLPIMLYDPETNSWSELIRNLPAFAITADPEEQCFWVHNGETATLDKVPYDTLRPEERGIVEFAGQSSIGLSGLAVRDGVLYATTPFPVGGNPAQAEGLYTLDKVTGELELLYAFPSQYDVWDLHYDEATDRMLLLSSNENLPPGPLGIFEIDLETFEITLVQEWFNFDPFEETASLQGLAVGGDRNYIFRAPYNDLQVWDAQTLEQVDALALPDSVPSYFLNGWVLGGLTWAPAFGSGCVADLDGNGEVAFADLVAVLGAWGNAGGPEDLDGDGVVGLGDLLIVLTAWGPCLNPHYS